MLEIEKYFNDNKIDDTIYKKNLDFNITNPHIFKILLDINMWANDIECLGEKKKRQKQEEFKELLLKRDIACIIDPEKYKSVDCDACHIVEVKDGGTYDVDNGLLINKINHNAFDANKWPINPDTLCIDILCEDINIVGDIINYKGKKISVEVNNIMKLYLRKRWIKYVEYKAE